MRRRRRRCRKGSRRGRAGGEWCGRRGPHQVRDAKRVELGAGELVVRRAYALMATPYAEQHLNALEMVRELVEIRVERKPGDLVTAEGVERGVRRLMEEGEGGKMVRAKAAEVSLASRRAMESGGSAHATLKGWQRTDTAIR
uniref:Uncharacterized protein n=1 Tax=Musa acuminata subsp. malaccensis TaxID=214687 RepID=A0A804IX46_MUSAM